MNSEVKAAKIVLYSSGKIRVIQLLHSDNFNVCIVQLLSHLDNGFGKNYSKSSNLVGVVSTCFER